MEAQSVPYLARQRGGEGEQPCGSLGKKRENLIAPTGRVPSPRTSEKCGNIISSLVDTFPSPWLRSTSTGFFLRPGGQSAPLSRHIQKRGGREGVKSEERSFGDSPRVRNKSAEEKNRASLHLRWMRGGNEDISAQRVTIFIHNRYG